MPQTIKVDGQTFTFPEKICDKMKVVVDGPFQTESGVQIGVQAMTSCVAINL